MRQAVANAPRQRARHPWDTPPQVGPTSRLELVAATAGAWPAVACWSLARASPSQGPCAACAAPQALLPTAASPGASPADYPSRGQAPFRDPAASPPEPGPASTATCARRVKYWSKYWSNLPLDRPSEHRDVRIPVTPPSGSRAPGRPPQRAPPPRGETRPSWAAPLHPGLFPGRLRTGGWGSARDSGPGSCAAPLPRRLPLGRPAGCRPGAIGRERAGPPATPSKVEGTPALVVGAGRS